MQERALRGLGAAMCSPIAALTHRPPRPSDVNAHMADLSITQVRLLQVLLKAVTRWQIGDLCTARLLGVLTVSRSGPLPRVVQMCC